MSHAFQTRRRAVSGCPVVTIAAPSPQPALPAPNNIIDPRALLVSATRELSELKTKHAQLLIAYDQLRNQHASDDAKYQQQAQTIVKLAEQLKHAELSAQSLLVRAAEAERKTELTGKTMVDLQTKHQQLLHACDRLRVEHRQQLEAQGNEWRNKLNHAETDLKNSAQLVQVLQNDLRKAQQELKSAPIQPLQSRQAQPRNMEALSLAAQLADTSDPRPQKPSPATDQDRQVAALQQKVGELGALRDSLDKRVVNLTKERDVCVNELASAQTPPDVVGLENQIKQQSALLLAQDKEIGRLRGVLEALRRSSKIGTHRLAADIKKGELTGDTQNDATAPQSGRTNPKWADAQAQIGKLRDEVERLNSEVTTLNKERETATETCHKLLAQQKSAWDAAMKMAEDGYEVDKAFLQRKLDECNKTADAVCARKVNEQLQACKDTQHHTQATPELVKQWNQLYHLLSGRTDVLGKDAAIAIDKFNTTAESVWKPKTGGRWYSNRRFAPRLPPVRTWWNVTNHH